MPIAPNAKVSPTAKVHESSYVDGETDIGDGTYIWHFSHILGGVKIGNDCVISQNVMIGPDVTIGNHCKIQNNVSIYKGVILEDGVFCGPSCVFTNVNTPRAEVSRKHAFEETRIGRGATIGANATIICGNSVGAYAFVGAGSVVTRPVADHALVRGNPARQTGWVSHAGEILKGDLTCSLTGDQYEIKDGKLVRANSSRISYQEPIKDK